MTIESATPCDRALVNEIEIDAPAQAVWEALSTGDGLANWFPLDARVTPGEGGKVWFSWGKDFEGESTIQAWEPERRLCTRWEAGDVAVVDDFVIEAREGGTSVLRLVSQGFGNQSSWDGQYDCLRKGWMFELRGLKHYLERHAGAARRVAWVQQSASASQSAMDVWNRLMGPGGLDVESALEPGAPFRASGGALEGETLVVETGGTLVARIDKEVPGLLRVELNPMGEDGATVVWFWLSTYGVDEESIKTFEATWRERLASLAESS